MVMEASEVASGFAPTGILTDDISGGCPNEQEFLIRYAGSEADAQ